MQSEARSKILYGLLRIDKVSRSIASLKADALAKSFIEMKDSNVRSAQICIAEIHYGGGW